MAVLERGGSAADAAVATAFTVSVAEPFGSGIGGGGAAVIAGPDIEPASYTYREVVARSGVVPPTSTGIPGYVAGLARLHADHGRLEWRELLAPAIAAADDGVPVSEFLAQQMRTPAGRAAVAGLPAFHRADGSLLREGDLLVQPELADTLRALADEGPDAFYDGSLTAALTDEPGLDARSLADFPATGVHVTDPVSGPVGDVELVSAAPPLVGVSVIQQLQVAEALGVADEEPGSAESVLITSKAWTIAQDAVQTSVGDPEFVDVPTGRLTDPERNADPAQQLRGRVPVGTGGPAHPGNTTHLSVVDSDGTAVSMTNTILSFWGSGESVGGYFLNDTLRRLSVGRLPDGGIRPGLSAVSWMAPTLALDDDGQVVLALGSPGGQLIPTTIAEVLARYLLQGQSLEESVLAPRWQLQGSTLQVEALPSAVRRELAAEGLQVQRVPDSERLFGSVQVLAVDPTTGEVSGVADPRRGAAYEVAPPG